MNKVGEIIVFFRRIASLKAADILIDERNGSREREIKFEGCYGYNVTIRRMETAKFYRCCYLSGRRNRWPRLN
jgi:hypothetical protein